MTDETNSNYVAIWHDYDRDKIIVVERDANGVESRKRYEPPRYFYIPDEEGRHETLFGIKCSRLDFGTGFEHKRAKENYHVKFESDISPTKRVLMDYYYGVPASKINYLFIDIEADTIASMGFPSPTNPYAAVNAVTLYSAWDDTYVSYGLRPKEFKGTEQDIYDLIDQLYASKDLHEDRKPILKLVDTEEEVLQAIIDAVAKADVVSGWNSEWFDIPYICERIKAVMGASAISFLERAGSGKTPRVEMADHFGTEEPTYRFNTRSFIDYMDLYKKFSMGSRSSYALGNILEEEVGLGKLGYDGSLEQLYHNDFAKFMVYNFRDVSGIVQLDKKKNFIALMNTMVHENTVMFDAALGTVSLTETGVTNHAHNVFKKVVHDKVQEESPTVAGAVVLIPRIGVHKWIGSVDINSLYPSTIRTLNMSPEKLVGQFSEESRAWKDIRLGNDKQHTMEFEDGTSLRLSAKEWQVVLVESKWAISAFGTVFDQGNGVGVIPDLLRVWYSDRKKYQAEKSKWAKIEDKATDPAEKEKARLMVAQYELLQQTKKLNLNSLYGALLNKNFRFGDMRLGASTTASGRAITTFMIETIGHSLDNKIASLPERFTIFKAGKPLFKNGREIKALIYKDFDQYTEFLNLPTERQPGTEAVYASPFEYPSVIYGDTDSCYFKTNADNKEDAVQIADAVADTVNASFSDFVKTAFFCTPGFDDLIKCGREIVGKSALFQAKKKYIIKVVDKEGKAVDEIKSMGSEIKKSDTPKSVQRFLKSVLTMILDGLGYDEVATFINSQRKAVIREIDNPLLVGVSKQINELDKFTAEFTNPGTILNENGRKLTIPGHVRAALNYNVVAKSLGSDIRPILSGDKVAVLYLKPNTYNIQSIAFPSDLAKLPKWFEENFVLDVKKTEEKMFDNKLRGIFEAWGYEVPTPQNMFVNSLLEF